MQQNSLNVLVAAGAGRPRRLRNVLAALGDRPVRIALMTAIWVTDRLGAYNRRTQAYDWKRRSERRVRAGGHPYAIVRPAGSTTTAQISIAWSSCIATGGGPAAQAMTRRA